MSEEVDWYERRHQLEPGQAFRLKWDNTIVRLDHGVPGDGTDWSCDVWYARPDQPNGGHWSCEEFRIHPGDLAERLADLERF